MLNMKLCGGEHVADMFAITVETVNDKQLNFLEFFVIEQWLKKYCKNIWLIEYTNKITISFETKHDLCVFKMCKISSRYKISEVIIK